MSLKDIRDQVQAVLPAKIIRIEAVEGARQSNAYVILAEKMPRLFCKIDAQGSGRLVAEAKGLSALAATQTLATPPLVHSDTKILIMHAIELQLPGRGFYTGLAEGLVKLHRCTGPIGWPEDNFIGRTPQYNQWPKNGSWPDFFWNQRLLPQLKALKKAPYLPSDGRWMQRLEHFTRETLGKVTEAPSLLHGDLWNGNVLCNPQNEAILIDPAVHYGHRECDLAMMKLFGGFGREFFVSYEQLWPLESGHEARVALYQLYHLLNHAQLFGDSYGRQAAETIDSLIT